MIGELVRRRIVLLRPKDAPPREGERARGHEDRETTKQGRSSHDHVPVQCIVRATGISRILSKKMAVSRACDDGSPGATVGAQAQSDTRARRREIARDYVRWARNQRLIFQPTVFAGPPNAGTFAPLKRLAMQLLVPPS